MGSVYSKVEPGEKVYLFILEDVMGSTEVLPPQDASVILLGAMNSKKRSSSV